MKKILLALIALSLPLAAQAKAEHTLSKQTVNAAVKRFKPAYCQHGLDGMAKALDQCFKQSGVKSTTIDQCLIGSGAMLKLLIKDDKISSDEAKQVVADFQKSPMDLISDKTIPVKGIQVYTNYKSLFRVLVLSSVFPRYQEFEKGEMMRYLQPGMLFTYQELVENCKK